MRLKGRYWADVCSGTGPVSRALRKLKVASREWEYNHGPWGDVTQARNTRCLLADIRRRRCRGGMFAPPCGTFSNALFWTGRLRSQEEPWGKSRGLNDRQREKVVDANRITRAVLRLIKAMHAAGLPWVIENPDSSLIWHLPYLRDIVLDKKVLVVKSDQCRYGRSWRKRTRFVCGNIDADDLGRLAKTCAGTRGVCPHNGGAKHFQLQGASPSGVLWTTIAAAYPPRMAAAIAHALTAADFGREMNEGRRV